MKQKECRSSGPRTNVGQVDLCGLPFQQSCGVGARGGVMIGIGMGGFKGDDTVWLGSVKTEKYVSGEINSAPITYFRYLNTICVLRKKQLSAFRVVGLVDL